MVQAVGYAGSVLIAASMMMGNIWRLRWINLAGAALFVAYGLMLRAWPVVFLDAVIVAVNIYYLQQMARRQDYFSLMPAAGVSESLLKSFLDVYRADIARFFPSFELGRLAAPRCVFILRNLMPVGLFVYEAEGEGVMRIRLDYVTPEYRDLKNARYLYSGAAARFREQGFAEFRVRPESPEFKSYVARLGFAPDPARAGDYLKRIPGGSI